MNDLSQAPPGASEYYGTARREIAPLLPASAGAVLEIGCGSGATMRWLRTQRPVDYAAAVEFSSAAAAVARDTFDEVETGDAAKASMAFRHDRFDTILALDILEHLPAPDQMLRRLRERMTETGTLIVSLPNVAHYLVSVPLLTSAEWEYTDAGTLDRTHLRFFTEAAALRLVEDAGFKVTGLRYNHHFPSPLYPFGVRNRTWIWYSRQVMKYLLIWPKHLFRYQFLIAARPA